MGKHGTVSRQLVKLRRNIVVPRVEEIHVPVSKHRRGGRSRSRPRPLTTSPSIRGGGSPANGPGIKAKGRVITSGRRRLGWVSIVVGVVVFVQHLFSHMGFYTVFSPGVDDLLIGYPTAAVLIVVGAMLQGWLGRQRS